MKKPLVIFSALEDVLIDTRMLQWDEARHALNQLYLTGVPLVLWSRWTFSEVIYFRGQMGITDPFVVENGGALYVPLGYFDFDIGSGQRNGHEVIEIGIRTEKLKHFLVGFRERWKLPMKLADELSLQELAALSHVPFHLTGFLRNLEFSVAFRMEPYANRGWENELRRTAAQKGFRLRKDQLFYYLEGENDKHFIGKKLITFFEKYFGERPKIAAIGVDEADFQFLENVHQAVLLKHKPMVQNDLNLNKLSPTVIENTGPEAWQRIMEILEIESEEK
ncbi:glucosyl-3-phosphoglycerate/mannosyl-3-phosphoglycerate phosphatase [bacterium BMS3Abin05]|nr:glucosyl-3-phosphoglycerate/mannosyl-3-phosphoglycerate phosphatase [bacterium BMS3Abin05]GBE28553.1 glucosyl-3-phosphoglycerate/mannosyl-3-phosphoglycerate phosphatase [bacterium BMS3Bbin03]HDL78498.1 hypothetical protein [Bacteroidota bacterium]HDZ11990.1 hypothetical protein [Bacteroidota bacterium]